MTSLMGWAVKVAANENCWCAPPIIDADRPTNTYWPDRGDSPQSAVNLDSPPVSTQSLQPVACRGFFIGGGQDRRTEGRERGWSSCGGAAINPLPTSKGPMGPRCELPQRGSWRSPDRPKFSHYFQHCRMASPDTIILLIVDYHAAIGGQDPRALLAYAAATAAGMYKNIHIKVKLT